VLKTVKPQSVDQCPLFVLNGSHLSYVVEEGGDRLIHDGVLPSAFRVWNDLLVWKRFRFRFLKYCSIVKYFNI
jgi:hypothetical protein